MKPSPLFIFSCFAIAAALAQAPDDYPAGPDSKPQPGVPKGEVLKFSFDRSKIFPGTYRDYSVYVPAQYTPDKAACLYVNQDGIQWEAPTVFDNGEKKVVDSGLRYSNGITMSPDQSLLYASDSRTHWVYSYQIQADGSLQFKQRYYWLHVPDTAEDSGADGMRVDRDGRLYVATRLGIQVCDQAGRVNCIISDAQRQVSNLCFGGENSTRSLPRAATGFTNAS